MTTAHGLLKESASHIGATEPPLAIAAGGHRN
jgi:hypothetical protein